MLLLLYTESHHLYSRHLQQCSDHHYQQIDSHNINSLLHHIYHNVWQAVVSEVSDCVREPQYSSDRYAVADSEMFYSTTHKQVTNSREHS